MRLAVAVVALAATFLGACVDAKPSAPTREDLEELDLSPDHTIRVDEDGFEPSELTIESGDVVLLVNAGDEEHSFTAADQEFDTGRMQPGDETTLVLVEPDQITFFDTAARDHEGTLVVQPQ
jgi:plastocyanin